MVVALAPDVLLRASYPLERITSCQMIHHLRHHTSLSLSSQKAKSSLESPRFLAVKHLDLSLMRDACASWRLASCACSYCTLQYNTYTILKIASMNFLHPSNKTVRSGKISDWLDRFHHQIPTPRKKNWIPLESGQTKVRRTFL